MPDAAQALFPLTEKIVTAFSLSDRRIEAHDPDEADDEDVIYLEASAPSDISDGRVLSIQYFPAEEKYLVRFETAHHVGGWPTHWTSSLASADEILAEIRRTLPSFAC